MAKIGVERKKKQSEYQAAFDSGMNELDEEMMKMQHMELTMISEGFNANQLDPIQL